ncbi:MAG: hypothetical protein NT163_08080 [Chlorobiales bacterium]|nr:hypothetical protein [Chlorobiales bacterium]
MKSTALGKANADIDDVEDRHSAIATLTELQILNIQSLNLAFDAF